MAPDCSSPVGWTFVWPVLFVFPFLARSCSLPLRASYSLFRCHPCLSVAARYRAFLSSWHLLAEADFIFSIDVDCLFVAPVGSEILSDSVST